MLYNFLKRLVCTILHCMFNIKFEGLENIPDKDYGGYIVCANHRSLFDPFFIADKVKAQMHFMAKAELFKFKPLGALLKSVGVFEVKRGKGDTGAVDFAIETVKNGKVLGIFPEGTRSKDGAPLRPKSGAALIAAKTGGDILPAAISFGPKLGFRTKITVTFGPIIKAAELGFTEEMKSSELKAASLLIMDRIYSMNNTKLPPNSR